MKKVVIFFSFLSLFCCQINLQSNGVWKNVDLPNENRSANNIKKIDVSIKGNILGILNENNSLEFYYINDFSLMHLPLKIYTEVENFCFSSIKNQIISITKAGGQSLACPDIPKMSASPKTPSTPVKDDLLTDSVQSSNSDISIEILTPTSPSSESLNSSIQCNLLYKKNKWLWAVKREVNYFYERFYLIDIFCPDNTFSSEQRPIFTIERKNDFIFFKFFFYENFFALLQENGTLEIFDTTAWNKKPLIINNVSSFNECTCKNFIVLTLKSGAKIIYKYKEISN